MFRNLFGKKSSSVPAVDQALAFLQRGQSVQAEEVVLQAAQNAERRYGKGSPECATAHNDLGMVLLHLGQQKRAIAAFRTACEGQVPASQEGQKDHWSYVMNLGQALDRAGEYEEAETVFRQGMEGRLAFYGRGHAGYAFGLEPLAALQIRSGRPEEALPLIGEAVANFWQNGHPRVAGALVIQAVALIAARKSSPPFADLETLPDEIIEKIAEAMVEKMDEFDPQHTRFVLPELAGLLSERLPEGHPATLNILTLIANTERDLGKDGDHGIREKAIRAVIDIYDRQGKTHDAIMARMGLALAQSDAGAPEAAVETYRDTLTYADQALQGQTGRPGPAGPGLLSHIQRNYGLLLAEMERRTEAEPLLRQSVTSAERAREREMEGRALVALGIFLQHGEQLSEARPLLEKALKLLDPATADSITARSHLHAIVNGGSCGCGDTGHALTEAFRELVISRLPADLLEDFNVTLENGDFAVQVQLKREPNQDELEHMNRIISHALEDFRKQLSGK